MLWILIFMYFCTFDRLKFTKLTKFRTQKLVNTEVLELRNWFHVKSEWQKNPEISTLCITTRAFYSILLPASRRLLASGRLEKAALLYSLHTKVYHFMILLLFRFSAKFCKVWHNLHLFSRSLQHCVEISGFVCHSDFTWNQFPGFLKGF